MLVLVCDDEASIRLLFRTALEPLGVEVVEASGLLDCLDRAAASRPDVLILDVMLRDGEAPSALPALRLLCPDTTILVVSSHADGPIFRSCLAAGADACHDKLDFLPRIGELVAAEPAPV